MFYKINIWSLLVLTIFTICLFVSEVCVQELPSSCAKETCPSCVKLSTFLTIISPRQHLTIKSIASLLIEHHIKFRIIFNPVLISKKDHLFEIENAHISICYAYKFYRNKVMPFKKSLLFLWLWEIFIFLQKGDSFPLWELSFCSNDESQSITFCTVLSFLSLSFFSLREGEKVKGP